MSTAVALPSSSGPQPADASPVAPDAVAVTPPVVPDGDSAVDPPVPAIESAKPAEAEPEHVDTEIEPSQAAVRDQDMQDVAVVSGDGHTQLPDQAQQVTTPLPADLTNTQVPLTPGIPEMLGVHDTPAPLLFDREVILPGTGLESAGTIHSLVGQVPTHLLEDPQVALGMSNDIPMMTGELPVLGEPFMPVVQDPTITPHYPDGRMSAFAKLIFDDGEFYVTTYSVLLGRDVKAARKAQRKDLKAKMRHERRMARRPSSAGDVPETPLQKMAASIRSHVSESGGIVGEEDYPMNQQSRPRKKTNRSKSTSSSSRYMNSQVDSIQHWKERNYQLQAMATLPGCETMSNAQLNNFLPDPHECPLIQIHPPIYHPDFGYKGISREHAKITYNFDENHFEMLVLGRNGVFHNDVHYGPGAVVPLDHSDKLLMGGVSVTFLLPNVPLTDDDAGSVSGKSDNESRSKMSFTFENGRGESIVMDEGSELDSDDSMSGRYVGWNMHHDDYDSEEIAEEDMDDIDDRDVTPPLPKKQTVRIKMRIGESRSQEEESRSRNKKKKKKKKQKHRDRRPVEVEEDDDHDDHDEEEPTPQAKSSSKSQLKEQVKDKSKAQASKAHSSKAPSKALPSKAPASKAPAKTPTKATKEQPKSAVKTEEDDETPETPNSKESNRQRDIERELRESLEERRLAPEECARLGLPLDFVAPPRKGPGRPPKDGIMSKREKAILARQHKEAEKARKLGIDPSDLPPPVFKPKPTKPKKDANGADDGESKDGAGNEGDDVVTQVDSDQIGEKKPVKVPPKPPRSPSPEMKESDYTEEQLARPLANYVVLIHEAITNSKTGALNLQQIYSAIERKYPFYKFRVSTTGWQSSVRHNLGQNPAFVKKEKEGKGWLWAVNPEISIEKERRKRASPPPTPAQQPPRPYYHPPPGGQYSMPYPGVPPHMQPYYQPPPHIHQPAPPPLPRLPPSLAGETPNAVDIPKPSTYTSPYGAKPAAQSGPDDKSTQPTNQPTGGPSQPSSLPGTNGYQPPSYPPSLANTSYRPPPSAMLSASPYASRVPGRDGQVYPNQRTQSPYAAPAATQTPTTTPPVQTQPVRPELTIMINTFKQSYIQNSGPGAAASSERIVTNAIDHVLFPDRHPEPPGERELPLVEVLKRLLRDHGFTEVGKSGENAQPNNPAGQPQATATTAAQPGKQPVLSSGVQPQSSQPGVSEGAKAPIPATNPQLPSYINTNVAHVSATLPPASAANIAGAVAALTKPVGRPSTPIAPTVEPLTPPPNHLESSGPSNGTAPQPKSILSQQSNNSPVSIPTVNPPKNDSTATPTLSIERNDQSSAPMEDVAVAEEGQQTSGIKRPLDTSAPENVSSVVSAEENTDTSEREAKRLKTEADGNEK